MLLRECAKQSHTGHFISFVVLFHVVTPSWFVSVSGVLNVKVLCTSRPFSPMHRRKYEFFLFRPSFQLSLLILASTSNKGVKWQFNPPHAPHFAGVFETMVKSAKKRFMLYLELQILKMKNYYQPLQVRKHSSIRAHLPVNQRTSKMMMIDFI